MRLADTPMPEPWRAALLAGLAAAPRRYLLPALPPDVGTAAAAPTDVALAFAIEAARRARAGHAPAGPAVAALFVQRLAALIDEALANDSGDPAFQATVLRGMEPTVDEIVRIAPHRIADQRTVRTVIDAHAHPGRLRGMAPTPQRHALAELHALAGESAWPELAAALDRILGQPLPDATRGPLQALREGAALKRLVRHEDLQQDAAVQRHRALVDRNGPRAGSDAASAQGRAAARTGEAAEQAALLACITLAQRLERATGAPGRFRAVSRLRTPAGFPGEAGGSKDEWDAALLDLRDPAAADVVLLAEVKASPAAATPDFARLHRGLERLALAEPDRAYLFAATQGRVALSGAGLRALRPHGRALPAHVIYCCTAPVEERPALLGAPARAVLLAERASLAFAQQRRRGERPALTPLHAVWEALPTEPRLRTVLHQYETAQAARAIMLHPDDLAQVE